MLAALLLALAAAPARALDEGPCADDIRRLCGSAISFGEDAVQKCLVRRKDQLSGFCAAAGGGEAPRRDAAEYRAACGADAARFCGRSQGGWSVVMKCLTLRNRDISGACRAYGDDLRRKYENILEARADQDCAADGVRFCGGASFARGLADCLTERLSRVSERCRKGVASWRRVKQLRQAERLSVGAAGPKSP